MGISRTFFLTIVRVQQKQIPILIDTHYWRIGILNVMTEARNQVLLVS